MQSLFTFLQNVPVEFFQQRGFSLTLFLQLEKAGKTYRKLKRPIEEGRCYEQLGKFNLAVEILVENDLYDLAIDTLRRYKSLRKVYVTDMQLSKNCDNTKLQKPVEACPRLPFPSYFVDFLYKYSYLSVKEQLKLIYKFYIIIYAFPLFTRQLLTEEKIHVHFIRRSR